MKKLLIKVFVFIMIFASLLSMNVSAAANHSFSHFDVNGEIVTLIGRDMYNATSKIKASDLGLDTSFKGITDIYCSDKGKLFILCGDNGKAYSLNEDYTLEREIVIKDKNGETIDFKGAQGIYLDKNGYLFLSDTSHNRVLILDGNYNLANILTLPKADLIPENMVFSPTAVVQDIDENYYVVSQGSYYGALMFTPELEFNNFYGANTVKYSVLDTVSQLWDLLTNTDEKRAKQVRVLPTAFVDLASDSDGYIYTCTGMTSVHNSTNGVGQITKLSPGGTNILQKRNLNATSVDASEYNFLETRIGNSLKDKRLQSFVAIDVNKNGYILALDGIGGLIYIYDQDCNLLGTMGGGIGKGNQLGNFKNAVSMTIYDDRIFVADSDDNSITIFEINEYGLVLQQAQNMYIEGNYSEAKTLFEKLLVMDQNCQFAYRGLAKIAYEEKDYEKALEYSEMIFDYTTYNMAYIQVRNKFIEDNFVWIFIIAVILIIGLIYFLSKIRKRKEPLIKNTKLRTCLSVSAHPFSMFSEIKEKKQGSLRLAILLALLFTITSILKAVGSSFLFRTVDAINYNALYTLATTLGLVILWSVSNWLTSTLMSGKGTLKEVFIVTSYSLTPIIIYNVLYVILSYFLSYEDSAILGGLSTVIVVFTVYLLIAAMMTVHEYSFGKFIFTTIITIFLMIMIVFILFMMVILLQQLGNFFYTLYMEAVFR